MSNPHVPHVKVSVIKTKDGPIEALTIKCVGCSYSTKQLRSRKQAWSDFRFHAMPVYAKAPAGTMDEPEMFPDAGI